MPTHCYCDDDALHTEVEDFHFFRSTSLICVKRIRHHLTPQLSIPTFRIFHKSHFSKAVACFLSVTQFRRAEFGIIAEQYSFREKLGCDKDDNLIGEYI